MWTAGRGWFRGSVNHRSPRRPSPGSSSLGQPRPGGHGRPDSAPPGRRPRRGGGRRVGGRRCVTPRQTCPRPDGLGRNLRSKTRWFTGFCNSHQVSHFATFFIDARAEISVAESRFWFLHRTGRADGRFPDRRAALFVSGIPWRVLRRGLVGASAAPTGGGRGGRGRPLPPGVQNWFAGRPVGQVSTMILPQVHLRKPCYDFSFL